MRGEAGKGGKGREDRQKHLAHGNKNPGVAVELKLCS